MPVTSASIAPAKVTGESGTAGSKQLTVTVEPAEATDKSVVFSVKPENEGITVSDSLLSWTEAVTEGTYTITATTTSGNKTASTTLELTAPTIL